MTTKLATIHTITNLTTVGNLTYADIDDTNVKIGDVTFVKARTDRRSKRVRVFRATVTETWSPAGVYDQMRIAYVEVD